jgi:hypothetical protein
MGGPPPGFIPQGQQQPMGMAPQGQGFPPFGGNPQFGAPGSSFPGPGLPAGGQMSPNNAQFVPPPVNYAQSPPSGAGPMINPQRAAALGLRG